MALGGSFSISGLASGLDTDNIIKQLVAIEKAPLTRMRAQQSELSTRLNAYDQLKTRVSALQTALASLTSTTAFSATNATSSDTAVATVSTDTTAQPGSYELRVSTLAQAQKIRSAAQNDSTTNLGLQGRFMINNKMIEVVATDTIASIAQKINSADSGVTASVLNGGPGQTYLTLSSNKSGKNNSVQLTPVSGDPILASLGLIGGAKAVRKEITDGAESMRFTDAAQSLGSLLKLPSPAPSGNITVNGQSVTIDLQTDSLNDIAAKISAADPTVTATVESDNSGPTTTYYVKLVGNGGSPSFTDENDVLTIMGVLQFRPSNEVLQGKDASFTLDGVPMTSETNTVTKVIAGATLTLLQADQTTPKSSRIDVKRDTTQIKNNVQGFVNAYNGLYDFIDANSKLDKETFETGIFFGDYTAHSITDTVLSNINSVVPGIDQALDTLAEIGVTVGTGGKLTVDDAKLTAASSGDPAKLVGLFQMTGKASNESIKFITGSVKTKTSTDGYAINITQVATKAATTAGTAFGGTLVEPEKLKFSGTMFGSSPYELTLNSGATIDDVIGQINNDARLKNLVVAGKDADGKLTITAKQWGTPGNFSVVSDKVAGAGTSGIGTTALDAIGRDVAGTIGGKAATGKGQVLTADKLETGTNDAEGLQVLVTAETLGDGNFGTVTFTRGIGQSLLDYLQKVTDSVSGDLTSMNKSIQEQIDDLTKRMDQVTARAAAQEQMLRTKFAALEQTISRLQGQSAKLGALYQKAA